MHTLPNSRHEAFAQLLAQGYSPAFAYAQAGFNKRNSKARAPRLAKHPNIRARIKALTQVLPRIHDLQTRFAPSALLMPETKEQVAALLWQISSGIRIVLPLQLRALTLLCRLKGWHLAPRVRPTATIPSMPQKETGTATDTPPSIPLTPEQQTLLTTLAQQIIAADQAHHPLAPDLAQSFLAAMPTPSSPPHPRPIRPSRPSPPPTLPQLPPPPLTTSK